MTEALQLDKSFSEKGDTSGARYDLTPEQLKSLEDGLVNEVKSCFKEKEEGLYAVWLDPDNKYANVIREYESRYFPEVATVTDQEEAGTLFLALVDTRPSANRVVHGVTISGVKLEENTHETAVQPYNGKTGFIVVDDLIEMGNFNAEEFYKYYSDKGIEIEKCISVETNFRIGDKVELFNGFTPAQLAYTMIFNKLKEGQPQKGKAAIFSSINRASIISFRRVGLQYEPLMGRQDLRTPEQELGKDFTPVAILYNEQNIAIFDHLGDRLPELKL